MLYLSPIDIRFLRIGRWEAGAPADEETKAIPPERFLEGIEEYRRAHGLSWEDAKGIVVCTGPGSPTSLRMGLAVANTLGFTHDIPLFDEGSPNTSKTALVPSYGRDPNITTPQPKK